MKFDAKSLFLLVLWNADQLFFRHDQWFKNK